MKNKLFHVSRAAALALCAFASSHLQAALVPSLTVTVPFDFIVSGKTLPAGNYHVVTSNSIGGTPVLIFRRQGAGTGALTMVSHRAPKASEELKSAQVVFACRAESCYMNEVRIPGWDGYIAALPKLSPAQKERQIALDARFATIGK